MKVLKILVIFSLTWGDDRILTISLRILSPLPDRIGLMVETSHPQNRNKGAINPFLGHIWILRVWFPRFENQTHENLRGSPHHFPRNQVRPRASQPEHGGVEPLLGCPGTGLLGSICLGSLGYFIYVFKKWGILIYWGEITH